MTPRPILLVKDPLTSGVKFHTHTRQHLEREGYIILHCGAEDFADIKVLTAHPFTQADVDVLRRNVLEYDTLLSAEDFAALQSIADRMEQLL